MEAVLCALMVSFDVPVAGGPAGAASRRQGWVHRLGEVHQVRHTSPNPSENVRRVIFISHRAYFSAYITADICDRLSALLRGSRS